MSIERTSAGKGAAPTGVDSAEANTRDGGEEMRHVQFRLPQYKIDQFNKLVYEKYGLKHGGKTLMFVDLINSALET